MRGAQRVGLDSDLEPGFILAFDARLSWGGRPGVAGKGAQLDVSVGSRSWMQQRNPVLRSDFAK